MAIFRCSLLVFVALVSFGTTGCAATIDSYESCIAAGNPMLKTYPPRCITPEGKSFAQKEHKSECTDLCGNGSCEEIVCLGTGCPCAESHDSCPKDCP